MALNPNIILQGQPVNVLGAVDAGTIAGARAYDARRTQQMHNVLQAYGGGLVQGDQGAMNAIAAFDPSLVMDVRQAQHGMMDSDRRFGFAQAEAQRAQSNADRAYELNREQFEFTRQEAKRAVTEALRQQRQELRAEELAAEAAADETAAAQLANMDEATYNRLGPQIAEARGEQFVPWEDRALLIGGLAGGAEAANEYLQRSQEMGAGPEPLSNPGRVQADIAAGLLPPETPLYSSGVTVNTGDMGPSVGTIPSGYALVEAPDTPAGYRLEPIPGGEAASDAEAAASAETRRAGDAMAATDIIVREAMRGIQAAGDRNIGGNIGAAVGAINPRSDNATLLRSIDALKGIATVEALMAAKQSSATGASGFGALSAQEAGFLQAQIGALDPRSPYIREDMMAATRRILQFVHGYEEGERQFRAQFGAMADGEGSGFTEGASREAGATNVPDFSAMTPAQAGQWAAGADLSSLTDEQFTALQRAIGG